MKWGDEKLTEGIGDGKFFKFKPGENVIRLVSGAATIGKHFKNGTYIGVCRGEEMGCEGCAENLKVSVKWLCWVIDRSDGKIKQSELPYTVVKAVGELAKSQEYAFDDLPPFDLIVTKTGESLDTEYTVMPSRKDTMLTTEETEEIMNLESVEDIVEKLKNPTTKEPF